MAALVLENPLFTVNGLNGQALTGGYLYLGEPNLNPETSPKTAYWDEDLTIVAQQPIRTNAGYPTRNGAPARIWVDGNYSILAKDSQGRQVFYIPFWSYATAESVLFIQSGTGAVNRSMQDKAREIVSVADFGAVGDGVTNDMAAIQLAIDALLARGGGILLFPNTASNVYYLGATAAGSVNLPVLTDTGTAFTAVSTATPYHFYLHDIGGITFSGPGVTIKSDVTNGGSMFVFDGARDIAWDGITLQSCMTFNSGTGVVTQAGMSGLSFTSTTRDSERIFIRNYRSVGCYASIQGFGDGSSANKLRGMQIDNVLVVGGQYGLAFQDNGSDVRFSNVRTIGLNARAYFAFGVNGHTGAIKISNPGYNNLYGLVLIKAYDFDTYNITLDVTFEQPCNGGVNQINFQSQHYPATQPVPAAVRNIEVNVDDTANTTGGSITFAYYQGAVLQATASAKLFNNIRLSGVVYDASTVTAQTVQTISNRTRLDVTNLTQLLGGFSIMANKGFAQYDLQYYSPVVTIGGSSAGLTYTSIGEFLLVGNMCVGTARITFTNKGAGSGDVQVSLPFALGSYVTTPPALTGYALSNFVGLPSPLTGFCSSVAVLAVQTPTGGLPLQDTHLTNTSDFLFSFAYPI